MTLSRAIALLLLVNGVLLAVGAVFFTAPQLPAAKGFRVGLVFDVGGKNDKSFNQAAWVGLTRARDELGIDIIAIEPTEGADRETALRSLAAKHLDLVIGVGFIFSADLERIAVAFPAVHFAGIDYAPTGAPQPPNLVGIRFREQEGAFVVGAIAGKLSASRIVGFVGGMKIPLIRKFEAGFTAGVHHACPRCQVISAYAGSEPKAFTDAPTGQALAIAQYNAGADIIFHAAGKTGDGVFAAAARRGARAIGVDSDQFPSAPCCVVTSMIKRIDNAVVDLVARSLHGRPPTGVIELGIRDGGVDFVSNDANAHLLPPPVAAYARAIAAEIGAQRLQVPSE